MPKKRVTKIDPRKELSPYLKHQINQNKNHRKSNKVSASLLKLHSERRRSLFKGLGIIVGGSALAAICLAYYVSPLANINSVLVKGADDLSPVAVVKTSGVSVKNKIFDYKFHPEVLSSKLVDKYPEIQNVNVKITHLNQLVLDVQEHPTIAYIKTSRGYRKVLSKGKLGTSYLKWKQIDQTKPLFIGYSQEASLADDLNLFNELPKSFQDDVKLLSGNTQRKSQVIFVMKNGDVVIGDIANIKEKLKYYNSIKEKNGKNTLIDLEVGAFSRPLTTKEKKAYGIS